MSGYIEQQEVLYGHGKTCLSQKALEVFFHIYLILFSRHQAPFAYGQFYILSTSIIITVLMVKSMWMYSDDFTFSVFLFVTMGFMLTSMNIVRQSIAVAILFYGYQYLVRGSFKKYLRYILIAFGFHASAIIMLPLYFVIRGRGLRKIGVAVIILSFLFLSRLHTIGNFFIFRYYLLQLFFSCRIYGSQYTKTIK